MSSDQDHLPPLSASSQASTLDNRMAWRGQPDHYEVWYLTLFHRASQTGFWIRYTIESPSAVGGHGPPYVQLWFCRGDHRVPENNFGINRRFPLSAFSSTQSPFEIRIADAVLRADALSGSLSGHGHQVRWDLRFRPAPRTHHFMPQSLYKHSLGLAQTLALSPNLHVQMSGTIEVDGQRYELDGDSACQSHLWGSRHAYNWAWGHCGGFDIDCTGEQEVPLAAPAPMVLEALSVRVRRGPLVVPLTLFAVYPDGLSGPALSFTEWTDLAYTRGDYKTGLFALSAHSPRYKIEVQYTCRPDDMIRTEYVDPDGTPAYCHFAATAACTLSISRRAMPGLPYTLWRRLRTDAAAQFEWGGRAGDSLVRRRHLPVEASSP